MSGSDRVLMQEVALLPSGRRQRPILEALAAACAPVPAEHLMAVAGSGDGISYGLLRTLISKMRPALARNGIAVTCRSGGGYEIACPDARAKLRVLLAADVPVRQPGRAAAAHAGTPAKTQGSAEARAMHVARALAVHALGSDAVLKAERLRAKGWTVSGIADQIGSTEAVVRALLGEGGPL